GGGRTTLDALAFGVPIVTWPGKFLRGRITSACYRNMGVGDLVADNARDYVRKAVRVATDRRARDALTSRILERNSVLFENMAAVREIEGCLLEGVRGTVA